MSEGYKIGAGYNVALVSLTDIETLPNTGEKFAGPKVTPLYSFGQTRYPLDRSIYSGGFTTVRWSFGFMLYEQWSFLSSTYCGGARSGQVTIYTNIKSDGTTFYRLNAMLHLPDPASLQAEFWYKPVVLTFSITGTAS